VLTELHIEQLGVIAELDLVLGPGLTALTGETGAGKTMLVEAISLLVGGRADATLIRPGASEARVEGRFDLDGEELVLARVIPSDGRTRAYVNGRLATVGTLSEQGARLVDLHGQHSHQSLLSAAVQRAALDRFGGVDLGPLREVRGRLTELDAELAALGGDARGRAREIDLLRFQVGEIDDARLDDPDEESALESAEDRLAGAVAHREAALRAVAALTDDDGTVDSLGIALSSIIGHAPFAADETRLRSLLEELHDAAADLRGSAEAIEEDPERLAEVRARRQQLRELCRKYGDTLLDVMAFRQAAAARLEELEGFDVRAARLDADRAGAVARLAVAAREVATQRRAAAPELGSAVAAHLSQLAMPKVRIEVEVGGDDPADEVRFLLGANAGEPALPLSKVASGGELARTMLALRLVLTEAPDTLVFDEIDAGIGGAAANAVAEALSKLSARHQVLVVTHLAQVAAVADTQVVVSKEVAGGRTLAGARVVTAGERVEEISRMLAGDASSAVALQHAEELIAGRSGRRP
jgi:DNA repair protein RecN (Recombination protein N)